MSRKPDNILGEVTTLAREGFKEIVLTGIHVASYGKDLKDTNLLGIMKRVHEVEGVERIRLSSIEPNVVTPEFIATISKLPKVCHHFHLSLQSGSDTVLKRMNRKYTAAQYKNAVKLLREEFEDVEFTTDIIVGFPGETQDEFNETLAFVKDIRFSDIHIFPYSPRKGTPAATMKEQISPQVKDQRVKELTRVTKQIKEEIMQSYLGQSVKVLFEQKDERDRYEGHTENYMKIQCRSEENLINTLKKIKIREIKEDVLYGQSEE